MYHDQGLPVIKHAGFEQAVNVTLGLPLIRTSPDHGTALDLAGSGRADPGSLLAAVQLAIRLAAQRHAAPERRTARRAASASASISCTTRGDRAHRRAHSRRAPATPGGDRPGAWRADSSCSALRDTTLDAIEIDRDLACAPAAPVRRCAACQLHSGDVLEFDFAALARARGGPLRVVGNLPYNISTPLLFHLLEPVGGIADLHVMLQREVVEAVSAPPRAARTTAGSPSCSARWLVTERLFDVGPGAFQPAAQGVVGGGAPDGAAAAAVPREPALRSRGLGRLHAAAQDAAQCAGEAAQPRDRSPPVPSTRASAPRLSPPS